MRRTIVSVPPIPPLLDDLLTFQASPNHASVFSYELIVYDYHGTTEQASVNIGKPIPDGNNDIHYDCTSLFLPLATGNYTIVVNTISAGGETASEGIDFYHA